MKTAQLTDIDNAAKEMAMAAQSIEGVVTSLEWSNDHCAWRLEIEGDDAAVITAAHLAAQINDKWQRQVAGMRP